MEELRERFNNSEFIYGYMYGNNTVNNIVLKIPTKHIDLVGTGFVYIWGGPGPDFNVYNWEDYGKTWAFDLSDFIYPYEYSED